MSVTVCPNGHIHSEHECRLCKPVKKEVCPVCMGTGDDYDYEGGSSMCGACLGTGRVKAALALPSADSSGSDNVPLPSGSGEQPTSVDTWDTIVRDGCSIGFYGPKSTFRKRIETLVSEERRQAKIEAVEKVSNRLDDLHQGTEGAGFVHYGEMGEWLDDYLTELRGENTSE